MGFEKITSASAVRSRRHAAIWFTFASAIADSSFSCSRAIADF
jgi:hypothetical protein